MRVRVGALFLSLLIASVLAGQQNKQADIDLQGASRTENVKGDLKAAIKQYETIVSKYSKDRAVVAQALLRMADCYEKLGNVQSRTIYERLVKEFSNQKEAAEATRRMTALGVDSSKSPRAPDRYLGVWNGIVKATNSYPLTISVFGGGIGSTVGTVAYPSHGCGGELTLRSVSPDSVELIEKLTYGLQACVNNGLVTLNPEENGTVAYGWRHATNASKSGAILSKSVREGEEPVQLTWVDRMGKEISKVGTPGAYRGVGLSPDGKRLAVHRHELGGGDIFIIELSSGSMTRLTTDPDGLHENSSPLWSPDGTRIAFASFRNDKWGIYVTRADGTGQEELLVESPRSAPTSWSPDGNSIVYVAAQPGTRADIWLVPLSGNRKAVPLVQSRSNDLNGMVSSDGKWIAYDGSENGEEGIYIRRFPNGDGVWKVSPGVAQTWRSDGKELFFLKSSGFGRNDHKLMAVDIRVLGTSLEVGAPHELFDPQFIPYRHNGYQIFAVSPDGQRFLIPRSVSVQTASR